VALCFAFGLMAKPQIITLPFALLLLDYWPLARDRGNRDQECLSADAGSSLGTRHSVPRTSILWQRLIVEKIPLLGLSAASAWITMRVQTSAMHLELPLSVRLENAAVSYVKYVAKILWPSALAPLYPHPRFSVSLGHAVGALFVIVTITVLAALSRRRYLLVGWLWFLGVLVPMIGLVQVGVQAMADRYAYIPAIGLFVMISWGVAELLGRWHAPPATGFVLGGTVLLALGITCHYYIGYWTDNLALWTHTLEVTHDNFIAEDSIADALVKQGRLDQAAVHYQNAVKINDQDPIGNLNLGAYEQQKQNYGAAILRYEAVPRLTQNPRLLALAFTNLGYAYYSERKFDRARQSFDSALDQQPDNPQAFLGLGLIAHVNADYALAIAEYQKALRLEPSDLGYLLLAQALEREGQTANAASARAAAEKLSRNIDAATTAAQKLLAP